MGRYEVIVSSWAAIYEMRFNRYSTLKSWAASAAAAY